MDSRTRRVQGPNDQWTIELDLRPTGRVSKVWVGDDFDDEANFEFRQIECGDLLRWCPTCARRLDDR